MPAFTAAAQLCVHAQMRSYRPFASKNLRGAQLQWGITTSTSSRVGASPPRGQGCEPLASLGAGSIYAVGDVPRILGGSDELLTRVGTPPSLAANQNLTKRQLLRTLLASLGID